MFASHGVNSASCFPRDDDALLALGAWRFLLSLGSDMDKLWWSLGDQYPWMLCRTGLDESFCCNGNQGGDSVTLDGAVAAVASTEPFSQRAQRQQLPVQSCVTASRAMLSFLQVPREFDAVRLQTCAEDEEQQRALQLCMRAFTHSMLRGCLVRVLLDDGTTILTEVAMDSDLTHLVLHVPRIQHPVALVSIEDVCMPSKVKRRGTVPSLDQLDERGITLMIEGGQFLSLVFDNARTRNYFQTCLKLVVMAVSNRPQPCAPTVSSCQPQVDALLTDEGTQESSLSNVTRV